MWFMQDAQKRQGVEFQRRAFVRTSERTHDTHSRPLPQFPLSLHLGIRSDECLAFGEVYLSTSCRPTYLPTYLRHGMRQRLDVKACSAEANGGLPALVAAVCHLPVPAISVRSGPKGSFRDLISS